ncbi:hypothetical protein F5Y16DRAFT_208016 [Xylariaceae sp. FL0255]|nr:hypothetical protein F5Y16DRAFT_208016 [Xylariaceae sp. FL0255]
MASTPPISDDPSVMAAYSPDTQNIADDPFDLSFSSVGKNHHRFSHFDSQLFALGPNASPAQARRALEAHLAETDRRLEEAGKLGVALVNQRKELEERLKDVETSQAEGELSNDLRHKLTEIEKEYNEVARESARAFLPKSRVPSNEAAAGSPYVPEARSGRRSVSPSKFEAQATGSPTKLSVPNRKIRNQPSNRIHDIEFAAEISTSLIAQVRNLQGLLAEKDEELRDIRSDNSKLEYEVEGYQQRLKALDDSEHRYKDENWNLETQVHDLMAKDKESSDREKKLTQTLNILTAEKNAAQRELDEIKLSHSKLTEEHAASVKHLDIELGTAKRNMVMGESERAAMQRKIEDLTGQNQELAKAVSASQRGRTLERESIFGMSDEDFQTAHDNTTPEQSPPPSPVKGTPRHSMLESETLKTSLAHAQRTIQSLRSNVHREKTERMETRRLLQEARDEIERLRVDPVAPNRRARKTDSKEFKKPPRLLGGLRSARSEIFADDPNWEDQPELSPHAQSSPLSRDATIMAPTSDHSDQFETANENSDAAFETANENGTETDDFHTGAEEFSSDDVDTETESPSKRRTILGKPPNLSWQRSGSVHSTASTEDEDGFEETRTPTSLPPLHAKFPLRVARGAFRRSRQASEEPTLQSSPASFANSSNMGTPQPVGQSLAAELGDFDGSDNESSMSATPSRKSIRDRATTPPPAMPPLPKVIMVDSGMMTDPSYELSAAALSTHLGPDRPISMNTVLSRLSMASSYSGSGVADLDEKLAEFPSPPTSPPNRELASLVMSDVHSNGVEPLPETDTHAADLAALHAKHAEQLKAASDESASTHAAAIEALKHQHAEERAQAETELKSAHLVALEALRSDHANTSNAAAAEAQAKHLQEIDALKASHTDASNAALADAQATHSREIDALKASHADESSRAATKLQAAHDQAVESLRSGHADQLTQKETELTSAHAADLAKLKLTHAEELARQKSDSETAFAAELESLKAGHEKSKADDHTAHLAELAAVAAASAAATEAMKEKHASELTDLGSRHADEIDQTKKSMRSAHADQIEALRATHSKKIDDLKNSTSAAHAKDLEDAVNARNAAHAAEVSALMDSHGREKDALIQTHAGELQSLGATHAKQQEDLHAAHANELENLGKEKDNFYENRINALIDSHNEKLNVIQNELNSSHAAELSSLKSTHDQEHAAKDAAHAASIATLIATQNKELDSHKAGHEAALSRELAALKETHAQEIESLQNQHAAEHGEALAKFKDALAKQVESSKTEGDAAHNERIEALHAAHAEIVESHKNDSEKKLSQAIESLKSSHERSMETFKSDHAASKAKEVEELTSKHLDEMNAVRSEHEASKAQILNDLANTHSNELEEMRQKLAESQDESENLKKEHEATMSMRLKEIADDHTQKTDNLHREKTEALSALTATLAASHEANLAQKLQDLTDSHQRDLESHHQQSEETKSKALAALDASHKETLTNLTADHQASLKDLGESHAQAIETLRQQGDLDQSDKLAALAANHQNELAKTRTDLGAAHEAALASLRGEHDASLKDLNESHAREIEILRQQGVSDQSDKIAALTTSHQTELEKTKAGLVSAHDAALASLRSEHQTTLHQALEDLKTQHAQALESVQNERDVNKSEYLSQLDQLEKESDAALARELEVLAVRHQRDLDVHEQNSNANLTREMDDLRAEHKKNLDSHIKTSVDELEAARAQHEAELASQARDSAAERARLVAEHTAALEALRKSLTKVSPILGFSSLSSVETEPIEIPELKSPRRDAFIIPQDHGESVFDDANARSPSTVRIRRSSTDSQGSVVRIKNKIPKSEPGQSFEATKRPGSASSTRNSVNQNRPPLPSNHREAIEAARTSSSHGGKGNMGPPLFPASVYRTAGSRPETPSNRPPQSPNSARGTPTPRAVGYADVQTMPKGPKSMRSRQSSMSSFASEIDTRFNLPNGMPVGTAGFGSGADKRMVNAVTQTMIGEYLWKYTRKAGRGDWGTSRHKRFFWVHPYTKTLYWSDRDPNMKGDKGNTRTAKSISIEAVRVVKDNNIHPPGIHNKSLVVIAPDRSVKFTCLTGQRHETWFNALSYLLLRTAEDDPNDAGQEAGSMAGNMSPQPEGLNASISSRAPNGTGPRAPPSLSSYNSRTTQNDYSAVDYDMMHPTLTPTHERNRGMNRSSSTMGRISGYWRSSTFNSMRSRRHQPPDLSIYEASEVNDSAEELRQIIEQQERESSRLENVRACCDGKHDVGTLPHTTKRGRLSALGTSSHSHTHPGPSQTPTGSLRSHN